MSRVSYALISATEDVFRANLRKLMMTIDESNELHATAALSPTHFRNLRFVSKTLVVAPKAKHPVYRFRFAFDKPTLLLRALPGDSIVFMVRKKQESVKGKNQSVVWECTQRKYTPIVTVSTGYLELIIKVYPQGVVTGFLDNMYPGNTIRVLGPVGNSYPLNVEAPHGCFPRVVLICGGTGITPMLLLIDHYKAVLRDSQFSQKDPAYPKQVVLITVNHNEEDIIMEYEIDGMATFLEELLVVHKVVSTEPRSKSKCIHSRLDLPLLQKLIPFESKDKKDYRIFISGTSNFNHDISDILTRQLGFDRDTVLTL
jgi:NAD(P)H-flavin reductase